MLVSEPKFKFPETVPAEKTIFGSYSMSCCIAALFELETVPALWEDAAVDWQSEVSRWAAKRGFQTVEFAYEYELAGFHLRFLYDNTNILTYFDGSRGPALEAMVFFGDQLIYNPSELISGEFFDLKLAFLPLNPSKMAVTYN